MIVFSAAVLAAITRGISYLEDVAHRLISPTSIINGLFKTVHYCCAKTTSFTSCNCLQEFLKVWLISQRLLLHDIACMWWMISVRKKAKFDWTVLWIRKFFKIVDDFLARVLWFLNVRAHRACCITAEDDVYNIWKTGIFMITFELVLVGMKSRLGAEWSFVSVRMVSANIITAWSFLKLVALNWRIPI
jgi:hypothetical protein